MKSTKFFHRNSVLPYSTRQQIGGYRPALHAADTSTVASSSHVMNLAPSDCA